MNSGKNRETGVLAVKKESEAKLVLKELVAGILFYEALAAIFGSVLSGLLTEDMPVLAVLRFLFGVILGTGMAVFLITNIYRTLERSLDMDKKHAESYTRKMFLLRMLVMAGLVFITALFDRFCNVWGIMIGIFCLKFSALSQPLTHKVLIKIQNKGR